MRFVGAAHSLHSDGLAAAAEHVGVHPAVLWPVIVVERAACGFLPDRRPGILFERHIFQQPRPTAVRRRSSGDQRRRLWAGWSPPIRPAEESIAYDRRAVLELCGYPLFVTEPFLVSALSLGSCFANLQKINTVISDDTYDPRTQSTYWTRWVMDVISGIVLSQIVYDFFVHSGSDTTVQGAATAIGQPLLAPVGGYSVDFVHGILKRAINTLSSFFGISTDDGTDGQRRAAMAENIAQQRLAQASAPVGL
jgi:hypothetical protein